jgi:putative DNA primase/helicase
MSAKIIASALGGRRAAATWMARCPAHADREPSLSIKDGGGGRVLVRCHAGCDQQELIAALKSRGIWLDADRRHGARSHRRPPTAVKTDFDDAAKRTVTALRLWAAAVPGKGTVVEVYLRSRGILTPVPPTLRFHRAIRHPDGGLRPAMVALVTRGMDGVPLAIHRTFLAQDGRGKAAVEPQKLMLGPCRGGAVRLGKADCRVMVAGGIETALAAMQATGCAAWGSAGLQARVCSRWCWLPSS